MKERTSATTSIWIPDILLGGVMIALAVWLFPELNPRELLRGSWIFTTNMKHIWVTGILFLLGLLMVLKGGTHCTICPEGLFVRLFWIPIRLIRWSDIGNAELLGAWIAGEYVRKGSFKRRGRPVWDNGCGIFVTTRMCPGYVAERDIMVAFRVRHPIGAMFFRLTRNQRKSAVQLFRTYFPKLEIQMEAEEFLKNE